MRVSKHPSAVAATLKHRHHDFDHYNLKDPLDELLFIICSTKTEEAGYRNTYQALKTTFPTHRKIAEAPAEYIARTIERGGLSNQKAKAIRSLLTNVVAQFGEPSLEPLRAMSDADAEAFLLSLPGVGKKTARYVLIYALDRQVFPVDTHCWRIAGSWGGSGQRKRTGTARHVTWTAFKPRFPPNCAIRCK